MATRKYGKPTEPRPLPLTHRQLHGKRACNYARRYRLSLRVESLGGWLAWDDVERRLGAGQVQEDDLSVRASVQYRGFWAHFDHAASPGIYQRGKLVRHLSYEDNPRTAQMWIEGHLSSKHSHDEAIIFYMPGSKQFDQLLDLAGRQN